MALTPSNMLPLDTKAPSFTLYDTISEKNLSLEQLKSDKGTVILFICNHCPYVKHIQHKLVEVARTYIAKGIAVIAINSNDINNYPEDSPEKMQLIAKQLNYPFPYLFDETQSVAKAYKAACTPDIYVFDKNLKCAYRGQFDDSRPGNNIPVSGKDLSNALDNLLSNKPIDPNQIPSIGCNIKWRS